MDNSNQKESFIDKTCQNIILSQLKSMRNGHLSLTLPNGQNFIFGKDLKSPKAELTIKNPKVFRDIILKGDIGFGESYVKGEWDLLVFSGCYLVYTNHRTGNFHVW